MKNSAKFKFWLDYKRLEALITFEFETPPLLVTKRWRGMMKKITELLPKPQPSSIVIKGTGVPRFKRIQEKFQNRTLTSFRAESPVQRIRGQGWIIRIDRNLAYSRSLSSFEIEIRIKKLINY
jgi:hypothetical protein